MPKQKTPTAVQIKLELPVFFDISFNKPVYFKYEKLDCGELMQVALQKGKHSLTAIAQYNNIYKIRSSNQIEFLNVLQYRNQNYHFIGSAMPAATPDFADLRIEGIGATGLSLRKAQKGAVYALLAHWSFSLDPAMVVLPTGTGKTETMFVATLADKASRTLVIVPTIDLKIQTAEKFSTWGKLRELGVISNATTNPTVLIVSKTIVKAAEIETAQVVVSTPALIARASAGVRAKLSMDIPLMLTPFRQSKVTPLS